MKSKIIVALLAAILIQIIYSFPIQKSLAEKNVIQYIVEQGVDVNNIISKRVFKNYKQSGYVIEIVYADDPEYKYVYRYSSKIKNKKYNIFCSVYNKRNVEIGVTGEKVKYPPLEDLNE